MCKMKNRAAAEITREDFIQLQPIGKIDRPPDVVIFLRIRTFGIFQVFPMYYNST